MLKVTFKKTAYWFVGSLVLCTFILVAHIYSATHKSGRENISKQLSRIDFLTKPDSSEAYKIQALVRKLDGVESTYFNIKDGILVYTFSLEKQTSENVFSQVLASGNYNAKRFIVDAATAKTGCPVIDKPDSFQGRLVHFISRL